MNRPTLRFCPLAFCPLAFCPLAFRPLVFRALLVALLAIVGIGASSQTAAAQTPDLREIRPAVVLLVDSSGSMDYAMGSASGASGRMPICTNGPGTGSERSRWVTLVEALNGQYQDYYCSTIDRRIYAGAPDQNYAHIYAQPSGSSQLSGILDTYVDRVKFGLMTYDNVFGVINRASGAERDQMMLTAAVWPTRIGDIVGGLGDYSYGDARTVLFPGCATTFMVNGGVRRIAGAAETFGGSLISVGDDTSDAALTNARIQTALAAVRPYGATPTGAMLDDFRYYLNTHPDVAVVGGAGTGDRLAACRERYAVLITDGQSSDPFRDVGCATPGYTCPYQRPAEIASDLCRWDGTACQGLVDGVFVVAFAVGSGTPRACTNDAGCLAGDRCALGQTGTSGVCVAAELGDIALSGGTRSAFPATDLASLTSALSAALDVAAPGTTTRTAPSFTLSQSAFASTVGASSAPQVQYQLNSGFQVGSSGVPWSGILERTRWVCDASLVAQPQPLVTTDRFQEVLNARDLTGSPRRLLTTISAPGTMGGVVLANPGSGLAISATPTGSISRVTGASLQPFTVANPSLSPAHFGLAPTDTATRTAILDYVHGSAPLSRAGARLGDIYHSTPVMVTPPRIDTSDQSYAMFRRAAIASGGTVSERATVTYVGTNDGVLHAFAVEDDPSGASRWTAGQELWGFVPPALLTRLDSARSAHQFLVDGTPVVRDVIFRRVPGDTAASDQYHTVLVTGMRAGGNVYVALDVTDPMNPAFLWQWTHEQMGQTYGRPGLGQVMVNVGGTVQERAIAVLPGGAGTLDTALATARGATGCAALSGSNPTPRPDGVTAERANRRCWSGTAGRSLHVVDVATGETLRSFTAASGITSPITGGVSMFVGDIGAFATRAFVVDADGVLWRLDMSESDPTRWTFAPMHDLFWGDGATSGQPVYDPPVVSIDSAGNTVVVVGGGDIDNLESSAANRVVSVTETVNHLTTPVTISTRVNWEVRLQAGEQVTGPIVLYSNTIYFGTFQANQDPANACEYGVSRLWGIDYINASGVIPAGYSTGVTGRFPVAALEGTVGSGVLDAFFQPFGTNQILLGVSITQRPSCTTGAEITDTYLGSRYQISNLRPGEFQLVAQVSGGTLSGSTSTATSVQTVSRALPQPAAASRVLQWSGTADY
jgi:type IV pilus assembly protein PilY1